MEDARAAYFHQSGISGIDSQAREGSEALSIDPDQFWELAEPHKGKLYNFIRKSLSFSEEADDVYQETLLRGLKYLRSYDEKKPFSVWLFAIAHNEIRKHVKNSRRDIPLPLEENLIVGAEPSDLHLVREVYRLAEGLKPKHKEIFFLFYDNGFSVSEISRITGVREGNVKFILNRARNTLRERMGDSHGRPRSG
jgi:RNA polymerase sigma-70 factor (ECF subfamily)